MDVNDLKANKLSDSAADQQHKRISSKNLVVASAASAEQVASTEDPARIPAEIPLEEPVSSEVDHSRDTVQNKLELNKNLNAVISALNETSDTVGKIEELVKSVDGLVEQVIRSDFPSERIQKLEEEANGIVAEIDKLNAAGSNTLQSGEAKEIRSRLENELGKTLDVILPPKKPVSQSLPSIDFSSKENILSVRTNVELARAQVDELKEKIDEGVKEVKQVLARKDVAESNKEASTSDLRDLDQALSLAGKAKTLIQTNPEEALASFKSGKVSYSELLS